ncbi:MAG: penicillin-binding transpeptidase domain-containing protein [Bacillota bacterium]|nr:penicillin-binding transpeptidase domain-containing protein [Bacillota bacterium]
MPTTNRSRKNLIIVTILVFIFIFAVALRVGYIQIVKGEEYKDRALSQQTTDTEIDAERGIIYDRNGEKLAQSVKCYTIYAYPSEIGKYDGKKKQKKLQQETAEQLAKAMDRDEDELKDMIVGKSGQIVIGKGLTREEAAKVRDLNLSGVVISPSTKRSYPNGTLAANVMGMVNDNNVGQSGLELEYNNYLSGVSGRMVYYTDTNGDELSYSPENEKYFEAENGCDIITTIDLVIQSYTEEAIKKAYKKTKADRIFAIVMNPKNGDVLAMAQYPTFDPNNPYEPASESEKAKFKEMSSQEQSDYLNKMWRNPIVCDVYEPGSVFKLLTTSIALEEGEVTMDSTFTCGGSKNVSGTVIHCWNEAGHGTQTLKQAVGNSCNPALMTMALDIGIDKFYAYMDNYNISGTTGIDFPAEGSALLQDKDSAGPVGLATIGFGQGVAVTPIQLINAINSFGNGGKLMRPRLVKGIRNNDTGEVEEIEPEVVRRTVSKETADEMCEIMEYVVEDGGGGCAAVKGYRVGGKTGTANKAVNGKYGNYTDSSCLAMAPMSDPQLTVLVIVDSPRTARFGSATAGPAVQEILEKSLKYLNIEPDRVEDSDEGEKVEVPEVVGKSADEAVGILSGAGLKYDMSDSADGENFIVLKQFPEAGTKVKKGTRVFLYD